MTSLTMPRPDFAGLTERATFEPWAQHKSAKAKRAARLIRRNRRG